MPFSALTAIQEIHALARKVLQEQDVLKLDRRALARKYLLLQLERDENTTDAELETAFCAANQDDVVPKGREAFLDFVALEHLRLESEPRDRFMDLSIKVSQDLRKIKHHLDFIREEKSRLEKSKTPQEGYLVPEDKQYLHQLDYFQNKVEVARDEIVAFMTTDIRDCAVRLATRKSPFQTMFDMDKYLGFSPYPFSRRISKVLPDPYDVTGVNDYSNKFLDLYIHEYADVIDHCRKSSENFRQVAWAYIEGWKGRFPPFRERFEALIRKSHLIAKRKQMLYSMLKHFEDGDYLSFVSMAPMQVEGIFADICRELGITENQLDSSSLHRKLDLVDAGLRDFHSYEYFAFRFPVLRNLVAHGGLVDRDVEVTALRLMLDLLPVCELTVSKELPVHHALDVLERASKPDYKALMEWFEVRDKLKEADFYGVTAKAQAADELLNSAEFWAFLLAELKKTGSTEDLESAPAFALAKKLKKQPATAQMAAAFLRTAKQEATAAIAERKKGWAAILNTSPAPADAQADIGAPAGPAVPAAPAAPA